MFHKTIITTIIKTFTIFLLINTSLQAKLNAKSADDTVVIEANNIGNQADLLNRDGSNAESNCECIPYYLCNENKTMVTDGANVIDIRMRSDTCLDALEVCCNRPLDPNEVTTPPPTNPDGGKSDPALNSSGCGRRNSNGVGFRIMGDVNNESQYGEFPWMVAILLKDEIDENNTLNVYQCGGSLIHPRVVLTAAHCIANVAEKTKLTVRAGEWDTQTQNERFPHVNQKVSQVIIHEQFNPGNLFNDIALLITPEPFNLTSDINTVCLPPQGSTQDNSICTATGWGKSEFGKKGVYQVILKKLDIPMVPRDRCQNLLRTTRVGKHFKLHESFVCAGGEQGRDTCTGDGGSPLICPILSPLSLSNGPIRYHQSGIVAWGIGCGTDVPGVYVNVALFRNWIDTKMHQLNFDTHFYTDSSVN